MLGSGQLGRMFAIAARRMGYRVHTLSPDEDTPTGQVADLEITASYDDLDARARLARNVEVVTFEFENVSAAAAEAPRARARAAGGHVLHTTQQRAARRRSWRRGSRHAVRAVRSAATWQMPSRLVGTPAVLKTAASATTARARRR